MTRLRPPVPYYGGKQRVAEQIVALLPEHEHYVEPYCGGLSVLLAKPRSRMETVNDLDRELIIFWRVLRTRRAEFEAVCDLTPHSRAEHAESFAPATDDLEVARRVFVRLTQGRMSRLTPTGWRFNPHYGGQSPVPNVLKTQVGRFQPVAERLARVSLECLPALELIQRYGRHPEVLLYVDPPYPAETRNGTNYRHEMPQPADHRALAEAIRRCQASVVMSGYACDLYDLDLYPDWYRYEIATYTAQGGAGKPRGRTEVLWSNRPLGQSAALLGGEAA